MSEAFDLSELDPTQLAALAAQAAQLSKDKETAKVDAAVKQINEIAASINHTVKLFGPKGSMPVKFRDPANPKNTWKGMGTPSKWLKDYLAEGRSLEEFLV
jgi:DNA-binding protein H-NS